MRRVFNIGKLVPTCVKCGSPVTDLLEAKVEEQGQAKEGKVCQ